MTLKEAELVLKSLQELSVDIEQFSFEPSFEFAEMRGLDAIKIVENKIKDIIHNIKRSELCSSALDSLGTCPICGEESLVTYMAGGWECKNCGDYEVAF